MEITVETYADFVTAVKAVAGLDVVFFYDNSPDTFTTYAIFGGRKIRSHPPGLTSKPSTFDDDFPDAVEMSHGFNISG